MLKICAISDMHGNLPEIPECDLLLIAGDICPHFGRPVGGREDLFGQSQWLMHEFEPWLDKIPAKEVVACWGNHDFIGEKRPDMVPKMRWHILTDQGIEVLGLKIWASPYQPYFYDWAFNAPDPLEPDGEAFLAKKFDLIPEGTDIIVVHGPPSGYGDVAPDGRPTGSKALLSAIMRVKPRLSVHGHIHCGRGMWEFERGNMPVGIIANVCVLDEKYHLVHKPMTFDF